jgi:hypothetical protein
VHLQQVPAKVLEAAQTLYQYRDCGDRPLKITP